MKTAIDLVGQELRWHTEHRGMTDKGEQYEQGFVDALVHIHNLFVKMPHNKQVQTDANCWEETDRCNDCPVDYPQKQCPEYRTAD